MLSATYHRKHWPLLDRGVRTTTYQHHSGPSSPPALLSFSIAPFVHSADLALVLFTLRLSCDRCSVAVGPSANPIRFDRRCAMWTCVIRLFRVEFFNHINNQLRSTIGGLSAAPDSIKPNVYAATAVERETQRITDAIDIENQSCRLNKRKVTVISDIYIVWR